MTNRHFHLIGADTQTELTNTYSYRASERGDNYTTIQIQTESIDGTVYTYTYDKTGNIKSKVVYAYTMEEPLQTVKEQVNYIYSNDTDAGWNHVLTGLERTIYDAEGNITITIEEIDYDAIGNPVRYQGAEMEWKGRQMTSYTKDGMDMSVTYDADGVRASKAVDDVKTMYQYVSGNLLYEKRGTGEELYYFYDSLNHLSAIKVYDDGASRTYYTLTNQQGDIVYIYDISGNKVGAYEYDAWGNATVYAVTQSNGEDVYTETTDTSHIANINPIRYRGYYYDAETGFYYLGSRYYDPEIGRFLNADCMIGVGSDITSYNMYAYCGNNPVNKSDSTGMWFGLDDLIAGAVGAAVGVASQFVSDVFNSLDGGGLRLSNWQTYVGAAIGGAIGGVASLYVSPVAGAAIGAGTATLFGQTLENHTKGKKRSGKEIAVNTLTNAVMEATIVKYIPVKIPGITTGRNSMSAVYSSGLTKLGNKTASRMSMKVMGKGFASEFCSSLSVIEINALGNYISGVIQALKNGASQVALFWCTP